MLKKRWLHIFAPLFAFPIISFVILPKSKFISGWTYVLQTTLMMMILAHYYTARTLDEPHATFQVAAIIPEP